MRVCALLFTHVCGPLLLATFSLFTGPICSHMCVACVWMCVNMCATHICVPPSDHHDYHHPIVPFLAIGHKTGSFLKQRLVSHPISPIHTFFAMDANRFDIMYSTWLNWLYRVGIGGLSCIAIYKASKVGISPSLTTKWLVVACELPAVVYLL